MKRIVSVSIGSSKRDHCVELEIKGESFKVERIGTDGDMEKAVLLIKELDGQVAAFGMGGIDVYLNAGKTRYCIKEALPIRKAAEQTPIVDGSGLKISWEKEVPGYIHREIENLQGKRVFMLPGIDRYKMAEGFNELGCRLLFGDLMVSLGINLPIKSLQALDSLASVMAPIICRLPFKMLYPTGKDQDRKDGRSRKLDKYFYESDIIAGDFHYIKQYMPHGMEGRMVVTNTVTPADVEWMRECGIRILVTTTPNLSGRSFGTNVIEALLVALIGKHPDQIAPEEYVKMLSEIDFKPRIEYLQQEKAASVVIG